ncbi:MAG: hypothetical protein GX335_09325 [Firmicutes bacterium]|nr:hypothetical protein [Bacillota bacterium]
MRAFKFRLEKVLHIRQIKEDQQKQKWALREKAARQEQAELERLLVKKNDITEFGYGQGDLRIRSAMYQYLEILDRKIKRQQLGVKKSEELARQAQKEWFLARREKEKITILKDKHYSAYRKEKLRREQKILDDMQPRLKGN